MPTILLLKGHPGTGKSTLARLLARLLQWPLVDKDDARDAFGSLEASGVSAAALNAAAYAVMWRCAGRQLAIGLGGVVVDCPLARRELYESALELAAQHAAVVAVVECAPGDEGAWRRRLEARGAADAAGDQAHKPCTWEALQALIASYDGCWRWTEAPAAAPTNLLRVDTTAQVASLPGEAAAGVVQWLVQRGLAAPAAMAAVDAAARAGALHAT